MFKRSWMDPSVVKMPCCHSTLLKAALLFYSLLYLSQSMSLWKHGTFPARLAIVGQLLITQRAPFSLLSLPLEQLAQADMNLAACFAEMQQCLKGKGGISTLGNNLWTWPDEMLHWMAGWGMTQVPGAGGIPKGKCRLGCRTVQWQVLKDCDGKTRERESDQVEEETARPASGEGRWSGGESLGSPSIFPADHGRSWLTHPIPACGLVPLERNRGW